MSFCDSRSLRPTLVLSAVYFEKALSTALKQNFSKTDFLKNCRNVICTIILTFSNDYITEANRRRQTQQANNVPKTVHDAS